MLGLKQAGNSAFFLSKKKKKASVQIEPSSTPTTALSHARRLVAVVCLSHDKLAVSSLLHCNQDQFFSRIFLAATVTRGVWALRKL